MRMTLLCNLSKQIAAEGLNLPSRYNQAIIEKSISWKFGENTADQELNILFPPPNVTGKLHLGHAFNACIQDSYVRFCLMNGVRVRWIPGFDHAGIAAQAVVQRLNKSASVNEIHEHIRVYAEKQKEIMRSQLKEMGLMFDWKKEYYTLDASMSYPVYYAFRELFKNNLIKRDSRIINWCVSLKSVIADSEVEMINVKNGSYTLPDGRKVVSGFNYHINYPLANSDGGLVASTTRPELIFADVALAVHPNDTRYSQFIGKFVRNPLVFDKIIPVVGDSEVNPEFGTGVMRITPNHDSFDFDLAMRHSLPVNPSIMDDNGCLINVSPEFEGIDRFTVKELIITRLFNDGNLICSHLSDNALLPICQRTGDIVEPLLRKQWFLNTRSMAFKTLEIVKSGELQIFPRFCRDILINWLEHNRDWCLSRQIVWGHKLPIYEVCYPDNRPSEFVCAFSKEEALTNKPPGCTVSESTDVLDTWFSSSLLPLSVLGWPHRRPPPTILLVTGYDILHPWVSRMVMMSLYFTNQLPFQKVACHGLVTDKKGRKMSKSIGNVIDPMEIIKVSGADGFRWGIFSYNYAQQTVALNADFAFEMGRKYLNKLWNVYRFVNSRSLLANQSLNVVLENATVRTLEHWMWTRIKDTAIEVNECMKDLEIYRAHKALTVLFRNDFCDLFLECSKVSTEITCLKHMLSIILQLHHPFLPHITQHIWSLLHPNFPDILCTEFPSPTVFEPLSPITTSTLEKVTTFKAIVYSGLKLRALFSCYDKQPLTIHTSNDVVIGNLLAEIRFLTHSDSVIIDSNLPDVSKVSCPAVNGVTVSLPVNKVKITEVEFQKLLNRKIKSLSLAKTLNDTNKVEEAQLELSFLQKNLNSLNLFWNKQ